MAGTKDTRLADCQSEAERALLLERRRVLRTAINRVLGLSGFGLLTQAEEKEIDEAGSLRRRSFVQPLPRPDRKPE